MYPDGSQEHDNDGDSQSWNVEGNGLNTKSGPNGPVCLTPRSGWNVYKCYEVISVSDVRSLCCRAKTPKNSRHVQSLASVHYISTTYHTPYMLRLPHTHTHTHTHDPSLSSPASPPPQFPLPYPQQSCSRSANGCDPTNGCNSASCMADRQFIKDLIANLQSELCIDRRHVHLTGMSAGAIMAYQVAKDLAPEVASIVPVSGLPFFGYNRQPSSPISVW